MRRYRAPPNMLWVGSNGSVTPMSPAVPGMSCISPWAPAWLTTVGLKPLSIFMTAQTRASGSE